MVSQKKQLLVQKIGDLLKNHQNFALIKIDKTTHQSLEKLRKQLSKEQAKFKVVKNAFLEKSLMKTAKEKKVFNQIIKLFLPIRENSALLLFDRNWSKGLKTFYQFVKNETTLSFKFGLLDDKTYTSEELLNIAQLPGREALLAKLIGQLQAPVYKLNYSLNFNTAKLIYILKSKKDKTN